MWIVRLALRRPLSVAVMALLMLVLGTLSFTRMNKDIFPAINLPVVMVIWDYPGLSAVGMERRMVMISERAYSTTVNGIEHIESSSFDGIGLLKVYFHPGATVAGAIAQINSVSETILRITPPGTEPPNIIDYNAANVPVAQLNIFSDTLSEQELFDYGLNFIRIQLFTIPGLSTPAPLGGMSRAVMVNLHPDALYANGLSPQDISAALAQSNVILPAGTAKIGNYETNIEINGNPQKVAEFNRLPVKVVGGTPVFLGDVAPVADSHVVQDNIVRVNGRRATYLIIVKHAAASTLDVVNAVKRKIPEIEATAPKGLKVSLGFDQSRFVRDALWEVAREAGIAAALVALMVLVFLGSPRSMAIVIASIPLSIFTAFIGLKLCGQTINTMTLGGLALAVGMLVDDATVEIENIHRNRAMGKPLLVAILDGAQQIAAPTFIGTLAICIVFFPVVLLSGVEKYLFTPLALAVVFAMLTSYLLSRTLVTTMARYILPEVHHDVIEGEGAWPRFARWFNRSFERIRERYRNALGAFIARRGFSLVCVALVILSSVGLVRVAGEDFFPKVDAGMMKLHVRAPTGTRIEETERIVDRVERAIRSVIPAGELEGISDNIGLPVSYDLPFYQTDSVGPFDADVLIQLKPKHRPTAFYQARIRKLLAYRFPNVETYFQAADIISQVLNFGLPASIDAQVSGNDLTADYRLASRLKNKMSRIPGLVDLRIAEPLDYPTYFIKVDRAKAEELGVTMDEAASSLLTSLSSSTLLQPTYWLDPKNGVNYTVLEQTPQHMVNSLGAVLDTPLTAGSAGGVNGSPPQFLRNIATVARGVEPAVVNHYTVQRVIDVNAGVSGRDLGSASDDVARAVASVGKLTPGTHVAIRGQSQAMRESFGSLEAGLVLAIILVYLLMVSNFQSWLEPFIIIMAVPGTLAGVIWMLVLTRTTINVESLMGAIMAVGVGVANANLVITFANELREQGFSSAAAAIEAGRIRFRPVIMTALAMILGMLPMALALGSGAELNAPLGRAVIGGLLVATAMTLFVVPAIYSVFSRHLVGKHQRDAEIESINMPGA
jgi:multidrug efflux pump subunit AcrB